MHMLLALLPNLFPTIHIILRLHCTDMFLNRSHCCRSEYTLLIDSLGTLQVQFIAYLTALTWLHPSSHLNNEHKCTTRQEG